MRCAKCVLPDTVPGSDFDESGICVWCREGYPDYRPSGADALKSRIYSKLRPDSKADCVVGISGGKDSSFVVWALKKHFGLRVHAFTYHHDGVEPFATSNARAVCESLDVPLTVKQLGTGVHLRSFQDYFRAWLDKPDTVKAGMTCVACKHLHLFGSRLAEELGAPFVVWGTCPLEHAPFLALKYDTNHHRRAGLAQGATLLLRNALSSPTFAAAIMRNLSLTTLGCLAYTPSLRLFKWWFPGVEQLLFFDYWPWNPELIRQTLERETAWTRVNGLPTDWHSDCLFNVFKEYLFQSMLGVSYTDGFLSNQVRAGILTRDAALAALERSKNYFEAVLPEAIRRAGLDDCAQYIDPSCFAFESAP